MIEGNMNCPIGGKDGAEILLDYCAQTLEPARAAELEKHLEDCAECRRMVEAQREVWTALDQWTPPAVSADFDARLYARIAGDETRSFWAWWNWKPAVTLAALCAVLVVAFLVNLHRPVRADKIDIEQVEQTLDDLDILAPAS
jgi:anti-sigma factor RsiW